MALAMTIAITGPGHKPYCSSLFALKVGFAGRRRVDRVTVETRLLSARASSVDTAEDTELHAISKFSEIVPDTMIFDDFERFPPTAATVSSSLLLGISSLPETKFGSVIETALADGECYAHEEASDRLSCFFNKALVNVGAELAKVVPGRVSTEVDSRLAYDTHGTIKKMQTDLFSSFPQAAAAAQAGSSVIQMFVGRVRDWARNNSGDEEIEAALRRGEDPGIALILMAAAIRNKQDIFSLLGIDYLVVPLKVLQSLKESKVVPDDKYSFVKRLCPSTAQAHNFTAEELVKWDQVTFASALRPAAEELLATGLEGYINQSKRVEEYFMKIWPPPNV